MAVNIGERYGKWLVIGEGTDSKYRRCKCDCGDVKDVKMDDRIQSCIDHIKTAVDVDPWAAELAEKALRHYGKCGDWTTEGKSKEWHCDQCGYEPMVFDSFKYCPECGAKMKMFRTCEVCKWRSDAFTSACTNGESERRADFVCPDDTCEKWEGKRLADQ